MEKEIKNVKLTQDEAVDFANARSIELKKQYNVEILPLLFEYNDDWIYGWFKAPTRFQIMDILGKAGNQPFFSGEKLLQTNLLTKESDDKFLSDNPAFDDINMGAFLEAFKSANKIVYNLAEKKTGK